MHIPPETHQFQGQSAPCQSKYLFHACSFQFLTLGRNWCFRGTLWRLKPLQDHFPEQNLSSPLLERLFIRSHCNSRERSPQLDPIKRLCWCKAGLPTGQLLRFTTRGTRLPWLSDDIILCKQADEIEMWLNQLFGSFMNALFSLAVGPE